MLPPSIDSPRSQDNRLSCLGAFSRAKDHHTGRHQTGRSSTGSHLALSQTFRLSMGKPPGACKYPQPSIRCPTSWVCWFSALGLSPESCSRLSSEELCCKLSTIKLRRQMKQSQLRGPGTWKRTSAFLILFLAQWGSYCHMCTFLRDIWEVLMPRSTQRSCD